MAANQDSTVPLSKCMALDAAEKTVESISCTDYALRIVCQCIKREDTKYPQIRIKMDKTLVGMYDFAGKMYVQVHF